MSSCFLCDCSYELKENDRHDVVFEEGKINRAYMKYKPIFIGSSGTDVNDQQHNNNNNQNYVSYIVKKIEFRASYSIKQTGDIEKFPDYIILFKVPFRNPVFDYYFTIMKNFMLYSEPECVLKYGVYNCHYEISGYSRKQKNKNEYSLIVDKPFIVGPNDYVGVLYMFSKYGIIDASAKVWFDVL